MKKVVEFLFQKTTLSVLLLLVQLGWLFSMITYFRDNTAWVGAVTALLSLVVMLYAVLSKSNPAYKIGWLVLIGFAPILGILLYAIYANELPAKRLREQVKSNDRKLMSQMELLKKEKTPPELEKRIQSMSNYISKYDPYPLQQDTAVKYYPVGEKMFEDMLADMRCAEKFIFFEYFIVAEGSMWNRMKAILKEKAKQGIDVRVMYDDLGCIAVLPKKFKEELEEAGVKVLPFNPLVPVLALGMNNRDHRKILVIDGNVGYNGGINIADEYINEVEHYGHWKDTGVRLEGAGVANLTAMFLALWHKKEDEIALQEYMPTRTVSGKGFVQSFSDSPLDDELLAETVYMDILWQAKDYVYIFSPYLIIDNEMMTALTSAAKRGVDVRLLVPGIPDKKIVFDIAKSYFEQLLEGGVRIYKYTPGFVHAKSFVSDDRIGLVGTINLDYRSLYLHFECGTLMIDTDAVESLKQDALDTFAISEEVKLENIQENFFKKMYYAALRVVSPLM